MNTSDTGRNILRDYENTGIKKRESYLTLSRIKKNEDTSNIVLKMRYNNLKSILELQNKYKADVRRLKNRFSNAYFGINRSPKSSEKSAGNNRRQDIISHFNRQTAKRINEVEKQIGRYWKDRVNNLLRVLKEKEEENYELEPDLSTIKREILIRFRDGKIKSLDLFYRKDFEEKYRLFEHRIKEKIACFREEIHKTQENEIRREKEAFIKSHLECQKKEISIQSNQILKDTEENLRKSIGKYKAEKIYLAKEEIEKEIWQKCEEIDKKGSQATINDYQQELQTWKSEFEQSFISQNNQKEITSLKSVFISNIKSSLIEKVANKVLLNKSFIYEEIYSDLLFEFNGVKQKIDLETSQKIEEIQSSISKNCLNEIEAKVEKELRPYEVKLKINYHKKLDSIKDSLRKEMTQKFEFQFKNFKNHVEQEKAALCKSKANANIIKKNLNKELSAEHQLKVNEKTKLLRKASEPGLKVKDVMKSKGPSLVSCSRQDGRTLCNSEVITVINVPLPSSMGDQGVAKTKSHSAAKKTENFRDKNRTRSASTTCLEQERTKKRYEELLKEHFHCIEPYKK